LGGMANLAGKPGGAKQLANAVANQPFDVMDTLTTRLSGSTQLAQRGGNLLSTLFGSGVFSTLASTVARFLGVGDGAIRTLMGLITPVVIGTLGKQQRASGLDAEGLAGLLLGQKDRIAAAMPSGLSSMLNAGNVFDSISASPPTAATQYGSRPAAMHVASNAASSPRRQSTGANWMYWALPVLALAGIAWYLLSTAGNQPVIRTQPVAQAPASTPAGTRTSIFLAQIPDDWISIGNTSNDYVNNDIHNNAGATIGTVKDVLVDGNGRMVAAIISVGRTLAIGEKDIAVPMSSLRLEDTGPVRRIVIDTTSAELEATPPLKRNAPAKP
ncbi:MAG: DUF937 domain-containing protein, partial [Hyphomicrobiaceae bacterium]